MALRTTFGEIIDMARAEARLSTNSSRGIDHLDYIKQVIRRNYVMLAEVFDWEHLELRRPDAYKTLSAGQRYYDFPVNLNPQKIERATYLHGAQWLPVGYGIDDDDYNRMDSDADVRSDPVTKWDYYSDPTLQQFEVWPIPATNGYTLHFIGQKKVQPLIADADRADLDDLLLSLTAAAEILRDGGKEKAGDNKAAIAVTRQGQLRASLSDKKRFCIGMNDPKMRAGKNRLIDLTFAPR